MRLEDQGVRFNRLAPNQKIEFMRQFRNKRDLALELNPRPIPKLPKPSLTNEEKAILKTLGIKQKDINSLRKEI